MKAVKWVQNRSRIEALGLINVLIVVACLLLANFFGGNVDNGSGKMNGGKFEYSMVYAAMTALSGITTYFGLLSDPSARDATGAVTDRQIRFSITSALVVVFVVYYSTTAYWNENEKISEYFKVMYPTFIQLITIVLAFYFGASAAVEIFGKRKIDRVEQ